MSVIERPNGTLADEFRIEDFRHENVGASLHVQTRPDLNVRRSLSNQTNFVFESVGRDDFLGAVCNGSKFLKRYNTVDSGY